MRNEQITVGARVHFSNFFDSHVGTVVSIVDPGTKVADRRVEIGDIHPPISGKTVVSRIAGQLSECPVRNAREPQYGLAAYVEKASNERR